jgi:hypothetical protein
MAAPEFGRFGISPVRRYGRGKSPIDERVAKLWKLRHSDPAAILQAYRRVVRLEPTDPLPTGVTFALMIDAIAGKEGYSGLRQLPIDT